jgi:acetyltransferase-like isoleucine patch superfamily enzyme
LEGGKSQYKGAEKREKDMIPKKIHYCWFGNNPKTENLEKYINSWKKYCPDYEIIEWNETNYDITKNRFIQEAYNARKYAFVSDYARLDIIYHEGGIYLDTDVELIKNLDKFLSDVCFIGLEKIGQPNTGLGFGAIKNSNFLKKNLEQYKNLHYEKDKEFEFTCVQLTKNVLQDLQFNDEADILQDLGEVVIYPTDYFCPLNPYRVGKKHKNFTTNSASIHHYEGTWQGTSTEVKKIQKQFVRAEVIRIARRKIKKLIPNDILKKVKRHKNLAKLSQFNKTYHTKIESEFADLKANYEENVWLSSNVETDASVKMGRYSYANYNTKLWECEIGKFVSISCNVIIGSPEHHLNYITTHPILTSTDWGQIDKDDPVKKGKVTIGNDVLISANVTILQGVHIGNGAVIGAGAVVTKDVKPYEVVGGVPAKHIKYRFDEETIKKIEELSWWDWPIEKINRNKAYFKTLEFDKIR